MSPVLQWTPGLFQYLGEVLPERFEALFYEQKWSVFASTDISSFDIAQFRYSVPLPQMESRRSLIASINAIFKNYKLIIDDGNEFHKDSIYSQQDLTQYQIIDSRSSANDILDKILDCESWRSFGMIFSMSMTKFGIYAGAFDDEGYILFVFSTLDKDKISDIYEKTFP